MYSVLLSRDLFTPTQVAILCSVTRQAVWDWLNSGRLASHTLTSRAVRITSGSLDALLTSRTSATGWTRKWSR